MDVSSTSETLEEKFRFDVKVRPPNDLEIEICCIIFSADREIKISLANNILRPSYNNLDFRYRPLATLRPQETVKVAQLRHSDRAWGENSANLDCLLKAFDGLYPQLQPDRAVGLTA